MNSTVPGGSGSNLRKNLPRGWLTRAEKRCRAISRDTPDGPVSADDFEFLLLVLCLHKHVRQKIGAGITHITVGTVPEHPNTRGFTLHRTDGSSTDFSWVECIHPSSHRSDVLKAMQQAIAGQILAFKQAASDAGQLHCTITGAELAWNDVEVDHLPPGFTALADAFAQAAGGYDKIPLVPSADGMIGQPMEPAWEIAWAAYHAQFARLQILSVAAHRKLTRERQASS